MAVPSTITPFDKVKVVSENRRARYDYFLEDKFEAGIELVGTEVKALRTGQSSIVEAYALVEDEQVYLINSSIPPYGSQGYSTHEPRRRRRLLMRAREIAKLNGAITRQGLTLVPLSLYFNSKGRAKVELALARGKKSYDKRQDLAKRDAEREIQKAHGRALKGRY